MRPFRPTVPIALFAALVAVPTFAPPAGADPGAFAAAIEDAHGHEAWLAKSALETKITVLFGGNTFLDGTLLFETSGGRSRIELADGTVAGFDGTEAWVSPAAASFQGARFHVLTWPYFLAVPHKLRDPGARLEELGPTSFRPGTLVPAARLTFGEGVGDTPDDWYVVYREPETDRLLGLAYIVTYGTTREEAEKEPRGISFHDFVDVDGVAVPTHWRLWTWQDGAGLQGESDGEARLSEVRFVVPAADAFTRPEGARVDPMPGR